MVVMSGMDERLDTAIQAAIAARRVVGATVLVSKDREVVYARAAGLADREAERLAALDTIYRLASLTKSIVSVTALAQADRGLFALDDPITNWLPELRPRLSNGQQPTITVRHLLSHTAGLSYGFNEPCGGPHETAGVSSRITDPDPSLAQNLRRVASVPLSYTPGEGWAYSVATDVLGAVVAAAERATLEQAVARYVTGPLAMPDTSFEVPPASRLAAPYADAQPEPVRMARTQYYPTSEVTGIRFMPDRMFDPANFRSGGSGMVGTATDFMTFLNALIAGRLLRPETLAAASRDHAGDVPMPAWNVGKGPGLFSGIIRDPAAAGLPHSAGNWEWSGLYGNSWFVDRSEELCVVSCTNTALEGCMGQCPRDIAAAIYRLPLYPIFPCAFGVFSTASSAEATWVATKSCASMSSSDPSNPSTT